MISRLSNVLLIFLLIRIALMAVFPVLGDEAYYVYWGMHPAGGYYDLPPMIGWWLYPFVKLSLVPLWFRLPNLISLVLVSLSIDEWLSHAIERSRAKWIAASFSILPLPFFAVLMFPDIPLLFFSYFSAYLFFRAGRTVRRGEFSYLFSGALMGASVLSKYFAIFLLPAYVIWFFFGSRPRRNPLGLAWFALGGLPFALQHFLWNETHCYSNIVFNLITRQHVSDGPVLQIIGLFLVYLLILAFPFYQSFFRKIEDVKSSEVILSLSRFLSLLWICPVAIFGVTACLGRGQGLHWLLFALPFFVMWAGLKFSELELARVFKIIAGVSAVLSIAFLLVSADPEKALHPLFEHRLQFEFAQLTHPTELVQAILPDVQAAAGVFTEGYTLSSVLNFDLQQYAHAHAITIPEVSIWGSGSRFGREFDWTQNFKALDGKRIVIITPGPFPVAFWERYFTSLKTEERTLKRQKFYISTGEGFKSALYLKVEFRKPVETYYRQMGAPCSLWDLTHDPALDIDFGGVIIEETPMAEVLKRLGCGNNERAVCCLGPDQSFIIFGSDETSNGTTLTDVIVGLGKPPEKLKCASPHSPIRSLSNATGMRLGLTQDEVSNLLGKPTEILKDGGWKYVYDHLPTHVYRTYEIQFSEGKVISFKVKKTTWDGTL